MSGARLLLSESESETEIKFDEKDLRETFDATMKMAQQDRRSRRENGKEEKNGKCVAGKRTKERNHPAPGKRKRKRPSEEEVAGKSGIPLAELAVHRKKVDELKIWIRSRTGAARETGKTSLLLLSGPPGCAKSTAVHAICDDLGVKVNEWTDSASGDEDFDISIDIDPLILRDATAREFLKFLHSTSLYGASGGKSLILIKVSSKV